jgi:hypothetical protein
LPGLSRARSGQFPGAVTPGIPGDSKEGEEFVVYIGIGTVVLIVVIVLIVLLLRR